jgi:hypothetical protein
MKDFWKVILASNPAFWLGAKFGGFGDEAQQAAEELEEAFGPVVMLAFFGLIIGFIIWLVLRTLGVA